ncbi:MAG TPA: ATP-binding protein [Kofleriaceae bacterium]
MTIYNPHLLARQELIETFVARGPLLDELIDDLRRGGRQHHLLVGGRGSGKTTLLLRLAAAIEDNQQLTRKCIPLRFPEEQYNVSRPSDFWMNAIDALADALERQGDSIAAKRLESSLVELEPLDEAERSRRSLALLESWAKQTKRLVVLLIDNFDLVLDRLAESLWALREALSLDNRLVVIGASSRFVEEAINYQSPFYDFFRVHELGPLSEEEARAVVLSLARRANTPKVAEVVERDPGRFMALFVLTGGTPRTLALLHTVLALEQRESVERDLDGLLDQLTPYYKARFDDLPPQSQVIVDKVALHWHPITAAECQAATHLHVNVVSAQLNRLVKGGILTRVSLPGPGKLGFQLSERFFNIWYLMRASRRLRRRLSWFVEFLRIFYGDEDLRQRAEELIRAAPAESLTNPAKFLAFATAIPDEALRRRLEFRAISLLADKGAIALQELMDLEGEDVHLVPVIDRVRALRDIRARIAAATVPWPSGLTSSDIGEAIARAATLPMILKREAARAVEEASADMVDNMCRLVKSLQENPNNIPERLLAAVSTGEVPAYGDVRDLDEANQIIELMGSRPQAIVSIVLCTEIAQNPLPSHIIEQLVGSDPRDSYAVILTAKALVGLNDWSSLRRLILLAVRHNTSEIQLGLFVSFLRRCVSTGLAQEALDLVIEAGLTERWAPLYEALRAVVEDDASRLDSLAPEMRTIARSLYDQLRTPDLPKLGNAQMVAPGSAPTKQKPIRRRAGRKAPRPEGGKRTSRRPARAKPP